MESSLPRSFFERDPVTCARELIGCRLRWGSCLGLIAETEAYAALGDEACHTWNRPSARAFVEQHAPGAAYVYFNYGMYWMLNVLVKGVDGEGFVLFRALEPMTGLAEMRARRTARRAKLQKDLPAHALCSGPGKLAQALGVTGADHGRNFCGDPGISILFPQERPEVETCVRVGISRAQHLPWRFLLAKSSHVSVRAGAVKTHEKRKRPGRKAA